MSSCVTQFESAFARRVRADRGFAFWKGRVAMYAILKALGVGRGDEVILPGYTCVVDVNPVEYLGARAVYADIDPATYNARPELIERAITPRTKVLVAQHTYGIPCEMDAYQDICRRHGIELIEDCCHAVGSTYRGKLCGTFGRAAYWSFQWNKPFTTGIGGMATTNDPELSRRVAEICDEQLLPPRLKPSMMLAFQRLVYWATIFPKTTAFAQSLFRWMTRKGLVVGSSMTCEIQKPEMQPDFFTAMGPGQARAGLGKLGKLDRNIYHRKQMQRTYDALLREAGWPTVETPDYMDPVLVRYPVRVADKDRAVAQAPGRRVEIGTWFECPLHPNQTPLHLYGYEKGMCPEAEKASREVINLPTHPRAGRKTAGRSVEFIAEIGPATPPAIA